MENLINAPELARRLDEAAFRVGEAEAELANAKRVLSALMFIHNQAAFLDEKVNEIPDVVDLRDAPIVNATSKALSSLMEQKPARTKSTQMLADLVNNSGRSWERLELHDAYASTYGIPESWSAPANAINNAIARAVAKGLIQEKDGVYLPHDGAGSRLVFGDDDA